MERLKSIKETLMGCVQGQMSHLDTVDTTELGDVIDMIKDLEEAMYYCTITEAMKQKDHEQSQHHNYYYTEYRAPESYRDMDRYSGRMYYPTMYDNNNYQMYYDGNGNGGQSSGNRGGSRGYDERVASMMRDSREGRSGMSRKNYMEAKEMHHDKPTQLKELEKYMQELSKDLTEMIEGASAEEKQLLHQKITTLASKLQ